MNVVSAYISIGKTGKTHGVHGELKVFIEEAYLEDFARAKLLYLQISGKPIPFFIENMRTGMTPILHFEDVKNREEAQKLVGKAIMIPENEVLKEDEREWEVEGLHYSYLQGFTLYDKELGLIGVIEEVVEFPQQEMAVVNYEQRELFIPLNEQLIAKVEKEQKNIYLNLPEGLLEL